MAKYLRPKALPPAPDVLERTTKVANWPMMANDRIGDCTCAAAGHMIQEWTAYATKEQILTDVTIIGAYSAITGYDPQTGANDNGAVEIDVLNYWRGTGIGGHQIDAYVALEPRNPNHIRQAIQLFGGCYIGVALPVSAQTQDVWSVPPGGPVGVGAPGSWGGHAVPVVGYDPHSITVVTWGALKSMTWGFWDAYCDEAYAVLSLDWMGTNKINPDGFALDALKQDLQEVVG